MNAEVIRFPSNKTDVLDTLANLLENGDITEFVIFAPNAKDKGLHHFTVTDGITLANLLMAQHCIGKLAEKFE